jgi:hypothetical protein
MNVTQQHIEKQKNMSDINSLQKLSVQLHHEFMNRQKNVLPFPDLLKALSDRSNNTQSLSSQQISGNLSRLAKFLPEFVLIKTIGAKKIVRFACSIGIDQMKAIVEERVSAEQEASEK